MHEDNSGDAAVVRRAAARGSWKFIGLRDGELSPEDGSVIRSGHLACVFCAQCQRWVDCYDGVPPETALERHAALIH
jgi:hypothetical protein